MSEKKPPHKTLTEKNNGLSSAQEVHYAEDFKKADKATEQDSSSRSTN
ncbi:YfhE family protein [Sporosarcina obsidiansis]|nr:YfhE family protein [Sporosarcina obsidiansis]